MLADAALAAVEIARLGDTTELAVARAILERLSDRRGLAAADALQVSLSRSSPPAHARCGSLTGAPPPEPLIARPV